MQDDNDIYDDLLDKVAPPSAHEKRVSVDTTIRETANPKLWLAQYESKLSSGIMEAVLSRESPSRFPDRPTQYYKGPSIPLEGVLAGNITDPEHVSVDVVAETWGGGRYRVSVYQRQNSAGSNKEVEWVVFKVPGLPTHYCKNGVPVRLPIIKGVNDIEEPEEDDDPTPRRSRLFGDDSSQGYTQSAFSSPSYPSNVYQPPQQQQQQQQPLMSGLDVFERHTDTRAQDAVDKGYKTALDTLQKTNDELRKQLELERAASDKKGREYVAPLESSLNSMKEFYAAQLAALQSQVIAERTNSDRRAEDTRAALRAEYQSQIEALRRDVEASRRDLTEKTAQMGADADRRVKDARDSVAAEYRGQVQMLSMQLDQLRLSEAANIKNAQEYADRFASERVKSLEGQLNRAAQEYQSTITRMADESRRREEAAKEQAGLVHLGRISVLEQYLKNLEMQLEDAKKERSRYQEAAMEKTSPMASFESVGNMIRQAKELGLVPEGGDAPRADEGAVGVFKSMLPVLAPMAQQALTLRQQSLENERSVTQALRERNEIEMARARRAMPPPAPQMMAPPRRIPGPPPAQPPAGPALPPAIMASLPTLETSVDTGSPASDMAAQLRTLMEVDPATTQQVRALLAQPKDQVVSIIMETARQASLPALSSNAGRVWIGELYDALRSH